MWCYQVTGLWVVFDFFCPQGKLQLGAEVTFCQFVQCGQNCYCCFYQVAAALPYRCNSVELLPQQVGTIQFEYCPLFMRPALGSTTCPALGHWLVAPPLLSAFVCLSQPLLGASWVPFGGWLVASPLFSAFIAYPLFIHWEFGTENSTPCPTPLLWGRFRLPPPPLLLVLGYSWLFMLFNFVGGGDSICPGALLDYVSQGLGRSVTRGAWCSLIHSADSCKQFWSQLVGRNGIASLIVAQRGIGTLSLG
jgi:hypothetical protein